MTTYQSNPGAPILPSPLLPPPPFLSRPYRDIKGQLVRQVGIQVFKRPTSTPPHSWAFDYQQNVDKHAVKSILGHCWHHFTVVLFSFVAVSFLLLGRHLLRMDLLWLLNNILNLLSGGTGWLDTYFELLLSLIIHVFFHLSIAFFLYCIFPEVNLQGYVVATKIIIFCHLISAPPIEDVEFYPFRILSKLFTPQERKIKAPTHVHLQHLLKM